MKKRYLFFLILMMLFVVGIGFFWKLNQPQQGKVQQELSERSQEFLETQRTGADKTESSLNQELNLEGAQQSGNDLVTPCYTLRANQDISAPKQNATQPCVVTAKNTLPPATITLTATSSAHPLKEHGGVIVRQRFGDQYEPLNWQFSDFDESLSFRGTEEVTVFFKKQNAFFTIAVTQISNPELISQENMKQILSQIEWQPDFMK